MEIDCLCNKPCDQDDAYILFRAPQIDIRNYLVLRKRRRTIENRIN